ncbi:HXXEE domain-containing protein [Metabacillus sp. B2-18]|uniref:HXXEE domain-containing protein n=1 Tax=Metabacillus sp. B2-18 TaxID=2897333 RepID=UPI001E39A262|nr:HXXEE domain-containing protein [Metabacillus sp. B2-18]UGB28779.1 HXXEE domain-containing protein [Metabacillus sp. B2-18]
METVKEYDESKFKRILLLFPPLYLIHDIEEIITVEKFLEENSNIIPFNVTALEFSFAFTLLWILASIGCFRAFIGKRFIGMKPTSFLAFLVPGILLANGIGHLLQFIFFKDYVPGIVTSFIILYPYSFFTAKFLITERVITKKRLLNYLVLGFIIQVPLAFMALYISTLIL